MYTLIQLTYLKEYIVDDFQLYTQIENARFRLKSVQSKTKML